jgi:hypothetical protein
VLVRYNGIIQQELMKNDNIICTYLLGRVLINSEGKSTAFLSDAETWDFLSLSGKDFGDWEETIVKLLDWMTKEKILSYEKYYNDMVVVGFEIKLNYTKAKDYYYNNSSIALKESIELYEKEYEDLKIDLNNKIREITSDLESILEYSPTKIQIEISKTRNSIQTILKEVNSDQLLDPLKVKLNLLSKYIDEVDSINKTYLMVYKNLIKPIKDEGVNSIRITVKWAIISILITSLVSIIITYLLK